MNYIETPGSDIGKLYVCVELQQHSCGAKREFATVWLEIDFNLDSSCTDCAIATVEREVASEDTGEVEAPPIDCELGNGPGPYNQGDPIEICLDYVDSPAYNACFDQVLSFTGSSPNLSPLFNMLTLPNGGVVEVGQNDCTYPMAVGQTCKCQFCPKKQLLFDLTPVLTCTFLFFQPAVLLSLLTRH